MFGQITGAVGPLSIDINECNFKVEEYLSHVSKDRILHLKDGRIVTFSDISIKCEVHSTKPVITTPLELLKE
jgi:hypothetical protein